MKNISAVSDSKDIVTVEYVDNITASADASNAITINHSVSYPLLSLKAYGRSWQSTEPSAETPADISSIGDSGNLTITVCGKNLFPWNDYTAMPYRDNKATSVIENNEFVITCKNDESQAKGVYISSSTINDIFKSFDGKTLTASAEFKMESEEYIGTAFHFGFQDSGRVLVESTGEWQKISVTMNFDASLTNHFTFYAREYWDTAFAPVFRVRNIQLEIGDTASEYEPYHSASAEITTGLPLRGIPVDSGGNYTDKSGQEWICDSVEYNYTTSVKHQRIAVIDSYNGETVGDNYISTTGGLDVGSTVIYPAEIATETTLTADEINQLRGLVTFDGVTSINNSENAEMGVEYLTSKAVSKAVMPIITVLRGDVNA